MIQVLTKELLEVGSQRLQRLPEVTRRYQRLPEDNYRRPEDQDGRSGRRNLDGRRYERIQSPQGFKGEHDYLVG